MKGCRCKVHSRHRARNVAANKSSVVFFRRKYFGDLTLMLAFVKPASGTRTRPLTKVFVYLWNSSLLRTITKKHSRNFKFERLSKIPKEVFSKSRMSMTSSRCLRMILDDSALIEQENHTTRRFGQRNQKSTCMSRWKMRLEVSQPNNGSNLNIGRKGNLL